MEGQFTKQFMLDLDATIECADIEQGKAKLARLAEFARDDLGLTIHGGGIAITREREPVESFRLGSDTPFRNMTSREGTAQSKRFERTLAAA